MRLSPLGSEHVRHARATGLMAHFLASRYDVASSWAGKGNARPIRLPISYMHIRS